MGANRPMAAPLPAFNLNFEEAFRAIFRDPDWPKKFAIGVLFSFLSLLIIGSFFVQGYLLVYGERVARAEPRPLPEWDDFGELLKKGFFGFVVSLVYSLPLLIIGVFLGLLFIPLIAISSSSTANPDTVGGIFALIFCGSLAVFFPLSLAVSVFIPAAHAQLILHNHDLGSAFRLGEVWGFFRRNLGQYLLMTVISFAAYMFLSQVGQCACYVGIFATIFLGQLFQYHLLGQLCWFERVALSRQTALL
jgi:hypothetical protein